MGSRYDALARRLDELTAAASPPPWKVDPEEMMGPGSWGIHHPASMGQIFYVGDPYPRGDNSPVENCYLAAPAHEYAAVAKALVWALPFAEKDYAAPNYGGEHTKRLAKANAALTALAKALGCEAPA